MRRKRVADVSSYQNPGEMSSLGSGRTAPRATATMGSTLVSSRPRPTALSILRRTIALNEGKLKMRRNARPVRPLLIDARYEETCRMKLSRTLRDHRLRDRLNIDGRKSSSPDVTPRGRQHVSLRIESRGRACNG